MVYAYFNYPSSRVTVHRDPNYGMIGPHDKPGQRTCRIDTTSISAELRKFRDKVYRFQSSPEWNDMWLEVDFQDVEFETAVVRHIRRLLGQHYKPFADTCVTVHC